MPRVLAAFTGFWPTVCRSPALPELICAVAGRPGTSAGTRSGRAFCAAKFGARSRHLCNPAARTRRAAHTVGQKTRQLCAIFGFKNLEEGAPIGD